MRKVSKTRVDDDIVSSTNGSLNDEAAGEDRADSEDRDDEERENKKNTNGASDDDGDHPESSSSKPTPKKTKKAKRGRKKKAASKETKDENSDEEEEEYEVEKVVGSKKVKGKVHYLIRWKGYSASNDTWEPEDTLSCPELIKKFKEEDGGKEQKSSAKKAKKRKAGASKNEPTKKPKTNWDSENADENAEYEVERILEVHHKKTGGREFLIHWKGWSSKFDSWEPEEHLNCSEMIKKFMEKVDKARTSDSRSLRVNPESTNRFTLQAPSSGRRLSKRRGQSQRETNIELDMDE